ncbi:hypothetical protein Aca07nite_09480 [Actinoplanes capillaceus]|uniref:Uncharacterized protein n=1 Tax=Actinoplanes campanulatus TaxID=113559 RepID=A0ABQ3WBX7_9ACTN|nr:hypothetical protein Aca07nite_09480 [Actinoplanes capillaceus]
MSSSAANVTGCPDQASAFPRTAFMVATLIAGHHAPIPEEHHSGYAYPNPIPKGGDQLPRAPGDAAAGRSCRARPQGRARPALTN